MDLSSQHSSYNISSTLQTNMGAQTKIKQITNEGESLALSANVALKTSTDDLSISMEASLLYQNMSVRELTLREQMKMADPLVINLQNSLADVDKNSKFSFDINSDGKEDLISLLSSGNGFLAIDKNNDGTINNGSELFGTQSGDGFADLAVYDDNSDGIIDESDKIFKNLKIWLKSTSSDQLLSLSEARVGVLLLANTASEFSLRGGDGVNAKLQKSGVAVSEDGRGLWVSHVDFAIQEESDGDAQPKTVDAEQNTVNQQSGSGTTSQIEATIKKLEQKLKETEAKLSRSSDENELKTLKMEKSRLTQQISALENMAMRD